MMFVFCKLFSFLVGNKVSFLCFTITKQCPIQNPAFISIIKNIKKDCSSLPQSFWGSFEFISDEIPNSSFLIPN